MTIASCGATFSAMPSENKFQWYPKRRFPHGLANVEVVEEYWSGFGSGSWHMATASRFRGGVNTGRSVVPHPFGGYKGFDEATAADEKTTDEVAGEGAYAEGRRVWPDGATPHFDELGEALDWLVAPVMGAS